MKKTVILLLACLLLGAFALAETAGVATYIDRDEDFTFDYNPDQFEIVEEDYQDDDEDSNLVLALRGKDEAWGYVELGFMKMEIDDLDTYEDSFKGLEDAGIELTRGEWNGFADVISYSFDTDDGFEQRFVIRVDDDETLTVLVAVDNLEDEGVGMTRDDAISAVLDTLQWIDD